mmetsp:Transcript_30808/g.47203  ORF Transcript_30808/g.47203 Transcript_30808/m.47203 type:complete len:179 (-) Transcript_30808:36-572(-)
MSFGPAVNQVTAYGTGIIQEPYMRDLNQDLLTVSGISKNHPNLQPPVIRSSRKINKPQIFGADMNYPIHDEYSSQQKTVRHNSEESVIPPLDSMVMSSNMHMDARGSIQNDHHVQTNTNSFKSGNALNSLPVNLPSSSGHKRNQNFQVAVHRKRLRREPGQPTDGSFELTPQVNQLRK